MGTTCTAFSIRYVESAALAVVVHAIDRVLATSSSVQREEISAFGLQLEGMQHSPFAQSLLHAKQSILHHSRIVGRQD